MKIGGGTDNRGNMFVVSKMLTTKMPLAAVLMQLAVSLSDRLLWLDVNWIPRELDKEADDLTNDEFGSFDPLLRMEVNWDTLPTGVMQAVLAQGEAFEQEMLLRKERKKLAGPEYSRRTKRQKREGKTIWE